MREESRVVLSYLTTFMYKSYNISIRRSMIAPRGLVIVLASKYDFHLGSINPCAFFFLLSSSFPSQITKNYIFLFPSSFFPACCSSKRRNRKKKFRPTRDSRKKIPGVKIKLATFYWFVKVRRCRWHGSPNTQHLDWRNRYIQYTFFTNRQKTVVISAGYRPT